MQATWFEFLELIEVISTFKEGEKIICLHESIVPCLIEFYLSLAFVLVST